MRKIENEYNQIYKKIIKKDKFKELNNQVHHGLTRLEHVDRVARWSFRVSKILKLDSKSVARGALLHDFFISDDINRGDYKKFLKRHPYIALRNSEKLFKLNDKERDIIVNHMYPVAGKKPKYKESALVNIVDKTASIYEVVRFQSHMAVGALLIFLYNIR